MKKLITFCLFIATTFTVSAQQLTDYYDAVSDNRRGFSYNVTIRIQKTANDNYTATLAQVVADSKGFYDSGNLYTCGQLGSVCNSNNFSRMTVTIRYTCNGEEKAAGVIGFTSLNQSQTLGMARKMGADGKFCEATNFKLTVNAGDLSVSHMSEIIKKIEQLKSNNNTSTNSSTVTTQNPSSNNPLGTTSSTETTSQTPSLESQYAKLGIPANTPTYTKQETTNQLVTQAGSLAGELLNDWNTNRDKRIEAERNAYAQQQSIEARESIKKDQEKFIAEYLPLMNKAKSGDENARMILYFASASLFSKEYVPQRDQWFEEALKNNNTDAILEVARLEGKTDREKSIPLLEKAISLGSIDAMVILAEYYGYLSETSIEKEKAIKLLHMAAALGSPNAMYGLGCIYKYGRIYNYGIRMNDKYLPVFNVILDDKIALEWFIKSIIPEYKETIYSKSLLFYGRIYQDVSSYYNDNSNYEISNIIYRKKGKAVVFGYEEIARKFKYQSQSNGIDNHQKFND